jgi:ribonuclease PH
LTEQSALGTESRTAVIDNGSFGTREIVFSTGRLAKQAAGSVIVQLGDTTVLSATTASKAPKEHFDFFPLTVDVEERMYAAGRIPGSFFRREGRPSEDAILTCRLIDRPLRPTFADGLRNEVQVVITVMALNPDVLYDVLAINASSASTTLAGLPFTGSVGGVRVALIGNDWVGFPTVSQLEDATFDMVVAGRVLPDGDVAIMMVEAESTEQTWDLVRSGRPAPTEEVVAAGLEASKPCCRGVERILLIGNDHQCVTGSERDELIRFGGPDREGLVHYYMLAGEQRRLRQGKMEAVRRGDHDQLDGRIRDQRLVRKDSNVRRSLFGTGRRHGPQLQSLDIPDERCVEGRARRSVSNDAYRDAHARFKPAQVNVACYLTPLTDRRDILTVGPMQISPKQTTGLRRGLSFISVLDQVCALS